MAQPSCSSLGAGSPSWLKGGVGLLECCSHTEARPDLGVGRLEHHHEGPAGGWRQRASGSVTGLGQTDAWCSCPHPPGSGVPPAIGTTVFFVLP